ncbi:MAG: DivIVA domain-containing protein [Nitrospina sp.]|nr:DivIVA domain-containing protein [Nitrospina sp.]
MRLTYLDVLEQCFHDKFRGYNKQEVDTFLHLVADDLKSQAEDIEDKNRLIERKDEEIQELKQTLDAFSQQNSEPTIPPEVEEELLALRNELTEKDRLIQEMKREGDEKSNGPLSQLTPERLKEKAKKIINTAKQHAKEHKDSAEKELDSLQKEIGNLQEQKQRLTNSIRATAMGHINKFKAGAQNGNAGNPVQD